METKRLSLKQIQQMIASEQVEVPARDLNHMRAEIAVGQIRPIIYEDEKGRFRKRYIMLTHQSPDLPGVVGAMLIHHWPNLATQDDVRIEPADVGYPVTGAIQTSNQAPVLVASLGTVVAQLDDDLLDLVLQLNSGGRRDSVRSGRIVLEPDDVRAQIAAEEWKVMQLIADEAFRYINVADEVNEANVGHDSQLIEIEDRRLKIANPECDDDPELLISNRRFYEKELVAA
jgi:hypothetical protein